MENPSTQDSTKASLSDDLDPSEEAFYRTYIRTAGVQYPANIESIEGPELKALAEKTRERVAERQRVAADIEATRQKDAQAHATARAAETAEKARKERIAAIRAQMTKAGITHFNLSDADAEAKYATLTAQARAKKAAKERFNAAQCPDLHTAHLEATTGDTNVKWRGVRDILAERLPNGYMVALLGRRGTGKTQLSVSVIRAACEQGLSARYVKSLDLFEAITGTFSQVAKGAAAERTDDVKDTFVNVGLLVIDELHQHNWSGFKLDTLINILDRRYDAQRPTIMIANLDKAAFAAHVGDSIVSRIHETGDVIVCDWPSYRQPGQWLQRPIRRAEVGVEK